VFDDTDQIEESKQPLSSIHLSRLDESLESLQLNSEILAMSRSYDPENKDELSPGERVRIRDAIRNLNKFAKEQNGQSNRQARGLSYINHQASFAQQSAQKKDDN